MTAIPTIVPVAATLRHLLAAGEYAMSYSVTITATVKKNSRLIARQVNEWLDMDYRHLCFVEGCYGRMFAEMPEAALASHDEIACDPTDYEVYVLALVMADGVEIARQENRWEKMTYANLCFLESRYGRMMAEMPEAALAASKAKSG